ncbi:hypothetical protein AAC387_Pa12g0370 [Persea americana]
MENGDEWMLVMRMVCKCLEMTLGEHVGSGNCRSHGMEKKWRGEGIRSCKKNGFFCTARFNQKVVRSSGSWLARANKPMSRWDEARRLSTRADLVFDRANKLLGEFARANRLPLKRTSFWTRPLKLTAHRSSKPVEIPELSI